MRFRRGLSRRQHALIAQYHVQWPLRFGGGTGVALPQTPLTPRPATQATEHRRAA